MYGYFYKNMLSFKTVKDDSQDPHKPGPTYPWFLDSLR